MGAPQLLFLVLTCLGVGISLAKHGEKKEGNYNFYTSLVSAVIYILILYWGGFFK